MCGGYCWTLYADSGGGGGGVQIWRNGCQSSVPAPAPSVTPGSSLALVLVVVLVSVAVLVLASSDLKFIIFNCGLEFCALQK